MHYLAMFTFILVSKKVINTYINTHCSPKSATFIFTISLVNVNRLKNYFQHQIQENCTARQTITYHLTLNVLLNIAKFECSNLQLYRCYSIRKCTSFTPTVYQFSFIYCTYTQINLQHVSKLSALSMHVMCSESCMSLVIGSSVQCCAKRKVSQ